MITKTDLLNNIREFTPEEIAEAINDGIVTIYELRTQTRGQFTPLLHKKVNQVLNGTEPDGSQSPFSNSGSSTILEPLAIEDLPPVQGSHGGITIAMPEPLPVDNGAKPKPQMPQNRRPSAHARGKGQQQERQVGIFGAPFSFKGRIRRFEFGISMIIYFVFMAFIALLIFRGLTSYKQLEIYTIVLSVFMIPLCWFVIAQTTKRCHDIGKSGWFQLIPGYIFFLLFDSGSSSENKYGYPPK